MMTIGGGEKMGPSIGRPCGGGNKKKKMRERGDGVERTCKPGGVGAIWATW